MTSSFVTESWNLRALYKNAVAFTGRLTGLGVKDMSSMWAHITVCVCVWCIHMWLCTIALPKNMASYPYRTLSALSLGVRNAQSHEIWVLLCWPGTEITLWLISLRKPYMALNQASRYALLLCIAGLLFFALWGLGVLCFSSHLILHFFLLLQAFSHFLWK